MVLDDMQEPQTVLFLQFPCPLALPDQSRDPSVQVCLPTGRLFDTRLSSTYYVPSTAVVAGDRAMKKTNPAPVTDILGGVGGGVP